MAIEPTAHLFKSISRTVWILSLISLFNDAASELLIPVMPIYLRSIGFSVLLIGVLEGLAEATAGLSKGYFGQLSDRSGKRVPFVRLGYLLSAISKPMMAVMAMPLWIFGARTLDRFGKGIRTGARDALLNHETTPSTKGAVFGFHRSMDTIGAVIGPAMALLYLHFHPGQYRSMFLIAFAPGLLAVACSYLLRDRAPSPNVIPERGRSEGSGPRASGISNARFFSFISYWRIAPSAYRKLVIGLLAFALFNSADAFLLLRVKSAGLSDTHVIGIYIFYNVVFAAASFPLGRLGDRIGLKRVLLFGLALFAFVYFGMAREAGILWYGALFLIYGVYAAATDGISKAWIASLIEKRDTATAIGFFSGFQSICAMLASAITGALWYGFGAEVAFIATGCATVLVIGYLVVATSAPVKASS